jgi:hypothetical protein
MIKKLTSLSLLFCSSITLAHEGHGMSDNNWHTVFHLMFWVLVAAVVAKGCQWWKSKKRPIELK